MRIFSGKACFSPSVPDYLLEAWVMHGGTLTKNKEDNRDASYFFCDGSSDPWFRKLSARSIVVIHANWVRDAVDENFPIPIARYVIDDQYDPSCPDFQKDPEGDDNASDQSQQEVSDQLLRANSRSPTPNPNLNSRLVPATSTKTASSSSSMSHGSKRPYLPDESENQENRPFKKARFLTSHSLTIRRASLSAYRPIDSAPALASRTQTLLQDCTKTHHILPSEPSLFKLHHRQGLSNKSSTITNDTPGWIKRVNAIASLNPICESIADESNKTTNIVNQSDSTLIDSASEPGISFSNSSKTDSTSGRGSRYHPSNAHTLFWSQAIHAFNASTSPTTFPKSKSGVKQPEPVSLPLHVSVRNILRSVSTNKSHASAPFPAMDSAAVAGRCHDSKKHDVKEQEHLGGGCGSDIDPDMHSMTEVTLFVTRKMYMGREMRYLGRD